MQREKVQIHSSDPSALANDRFNLILVSGKELSLGAVGTLLGLALTSIRPGCVDASCVKAGGVLWFYGFNKHLPALGRCQAGTSGQW